MIRVVVGDKDRVDLAKRYMELIQACGDPSSRVEEQILTTGLDQHRGPVSLRIGNMAAAWVSCHGTFSIVRCIAPWSCACGSRCESGETDCLNCSTIACHMAAAQFFSVFLLCEAEQSPDEALVRE